MRCNVYSIRDAVCRPHGDFLVYTVPHGDWRTAGSVLFGAAIAAPIWLAPCFRSMKSLGPPWLVIEALAF